MPRVAMRHEERAAHAAELRARKAEASAERIWRGLPPEFDSAAASTVEALMYELREYGIDQLKKLNTQRRLADLSVEQVREVIARLTKLRPRYPLITDELIAVLREQTQ